MFLIDIATKRYLDTGATIYGPNRVISLLFVVGRGSLEILCEDRVVQSVGRGEILNLELALGDGVNLTTARVSSPTTLYLLPFEKIEEILARAKQLQTLQNLAHLLRARALND
jgi:CRP-like cAMP-binding protein